MLYRFVYRIIPIRITCRPSKVGASFNRKVPPDKKEFKKSSDGVATMEVDKQLRDLRQLAHVILLYSLIPTSNILLGQVSVQSVQW